MAKEKKTMQLRGKLSQSFTYVRTESNERERIADSRLVRPPVKYMSQSYFESQPNGEIMQTIPLSSGLSDLPEIFMNNGSKGLEIFGEIEIIDKKPKSGDSSVISVGVLMASGIFCIYNHSVGLEGILHLSVSVNVNGASFGLRNQELTVRAPISLRFTPKDKSQISKWNQGLSKFCEFIQKKPLLKSFSLVDSESLRNFKAKMESRVKSIKAKCKMPESIKGITSYSWYCEENFLAHSKSFPVENILISSPDLEIDENFFISSNLWAKITKLQQNLPNNIFAIMSATLTMGQFCLREYQKETTMTTDNICLERLPYVKWSFRISNEKTAVDIKLNSKEAYEKWLMAFMKLYKYKNFEKITKINKGQTERNNIITSDSRQLSNFNPDGIPLYTQDKQIAKTKYPSDSNVIPEAKQILTSKDNELLVEEAVEIVKNDEMTSENCCKKAKIYKNKFKPRNDKIKDCPICDFVYDDVKESDIYISLPVRCERKACSQKSKFSNFITQIVPKFIDKPRQNNNFPKGKTFLSSLSEWNLSKTNIEYKLKRRRFSSNYICGDLRVKREYTKGCSHFVSDTLSNMESSRSNITKSQPIMQDSDLQNSCSEENVYEEPILRIK